MKRRDFFKTTIKGTAALVLTLVGHKTEPEPETVVEMGIDQAAEGGDQGGYLVPKEYVDQVMAEIRGGRGVFKRKYTIQKPAETNPFGGRVVNFVDIPGYDPQATGLVKGFNKGKSFLEFLKETKEIA